MTVSGASNTEFAPAPDGGGQVRLTSGSWDSEITWTLYGDAAAGGVEITSGIGGAHVHPESFYEGIHFHRVIPGFMNQFGCPNAKDPKSRRAGTGGPPDGTFKNLKTGATERRSNGGNIKDENISRDTNAPGTLSMANTGQPNSGGSQFFLNVADNRNLDWFSPGQSKHPVFGKITSGMDVVK